MFFFLYLPRSLQAFPSFWGPFFGFRQRYSHSSLWSVSIIVSFFSVGFLLLCVCVAVVVASMQNYDCWRRSTGRRAGNPLFSIRTGGLECLSSSRAKQRSKRLLVYVERCKPSSVAQMFNSQRLRWQSKQVLRERFHCERSAEMGLN